MVLIWGIFLLGIAILDAYRSLHVFPVGGRLSGLWFLLRYRRWVVPVDALFFLWALTLIFVQRSTLATLFGITNSR